MDFTWIWQTCILYFWNISLKLQLDSPGTCEVKIMKAWKSKIQGILQRSTPGKWLKKRTNIIWRLYWRSYWKYLNEPLVTSGNMFQYVAYVMVLKDTKWDFWIRTLYGWISIIYRGVWLVPKLYLYYRQSTQYCYIRCTGLHSSD